MSVLTNCAKVLRCLAQIRINPARLASTTVSAAPRGTCSWGDEPACSEKSLEKKKATMKPPPKSMWENPDCCLDPCKDYLPRFDDLYYKPTNKAKRKYTRTWCECPPIKIMPKKICCFDRVELPPIERRTKPECPKTACPADSTSSCLSFANKRCLKVRVPGCCPARDPPRCGKRPRWPRRCGKICTPYPSYSECSRDKPKPLRPVECKCLYPGPACQVY